MSKKIMPLGDRMTFFLKYVDDTYCNTEEGSENYTKFLLTPACRFAGVNRSDMCT